MNAITPIVNLIGDLDTYADELDGEGWHNAANACRAAIATITRLEAIEGWAEALVEECEGGKQSPSLGTLAKLESALFLSWKANSAPD